MPLFYGNPLIIGGHCPRKCQWRRTLIFSLICAWINDWTNNRDAGDLIRLPAHYDVTVMTNDKIIFYCRWYSQATEVNAYSVSAKNHAGKSLNSIIIGLRTLIARFVGTTWGPSGAGKTQVGPMLPPWTLLSGKTSIQKLGCRWFSHIV